MPAFVLRACVASACVRVCTFWTDLSVWCVPVLCCVYVSSCARAVCGQKSTSARRCRAAAAPHAWTALIRMSACVCRGRMDVRFLFHFVFAVFLLVFACFCFVVRLCCG